MLPLETQKKLCFGSDYTHTQKKRKQNNPFIKQFITKTRKQNRQAKVTSLISVSLLIHPRNTESVLNFKKVKCILSIGFNL